MVSKNNKQLYINKMQQQKQRFGIRKLTVGVASVLLGTTIFIGNQVAHADTTNNSINNEEITAFTANNSSVAEEQTNPNSSTAINSDSQVATPLLPKLNQLLMLIIQLIRMLHNQQLIMQIILLIILITIFLPLQKNKMILIIILQ